MSAPTTFNFGKVDMTLEELQKIIPFERDICSDAFNARVVIQLTIPAINLLSSHDTVDEIVVCETINRGRQQTNQLFEDFLLKVQGRDPHRHPAYQVIDMGEEIYLKEDKEMRRPDVEYTGPKLKDLFA